MTTRVSRHTEIFFVLAIVIAMAFTFMPRAYAEDGRDYYLRSSIPSSGIAEQIASKINKIRVPEPTHTTYIDTTFVLDDDITVRYQSDFRGERISVNNPLITPMYSVESNGIDDFLYKCRNYRELFGDGPNDPIPSYVQDYTYLVPGLQRQLSPNAALNDPKRDFTLVSVAKVGDPFDRSAPCPMYIFYFADAAKNRIAVFHTVEGLVEVPSGKRGEPEWAFPFSPASLYDAGWRFIRGREQAILIEKNLMVGRLIYKDDPEFLEAYLLGIQQRKEKEQKIEERESAPRSPLETQLRDIAQKHGLQYPDLTFTLEDSYKLSDGTWVHDFYNIDGARTSMFETPEGVHEYTQKVGNRKSPRWRVGSPVEQKQLHEIIAKGRDIIKITRHYVTRSHHPNPVSVRLEYFKENGTYFYGRSADRLDGLKPAAKRTNVKDQDEDEWLRDGGVCLYQRR